MGVQLDGSRGALVSRLEVIEVPRVRRRRRKAERARIVAQSMMPGVMLADVERQHGTTRWRIYDWHQQIRKVNSVVPESVAALPMFAELVVDDTVVAAALAVIGSHGGRLEPWPSCQFFFNLDETERIHAVNRKQVHKYLDAAPVATCPVLLTYC